MPFLPFTDIGVGCGHLSWKSMPPLIERLAEIYQERLLQEQRAVELRKAPDCDSKGHATAGEISSLRFLGVAEFVLKKVKASFCQKLKRAAELKLRLFERYEAGERISESYVTMLSYKDVYNALAAGAVEVAQALASHMGGSEKLEKKHDSPFDRALGYAVRAFVLNLPEQMQVRTQNFADVCQQPGNGAFAGYAEVFEALLANDLAAADVGLRHIVEGHKRQSRGSGVFNCTEDEIICVWGTGLANLARNRRLPVQGVPPLIPDELLVA